MTNYNDSKIFCIKSLLTDKVFIGATTQKLESRMKIYKTHYRSFLNNKFHHCNSFEILEYEDAFIELIQAYPCNNKKELNFMEGEIVRAELNAVNTRIAGRTRAQYNIDNHQKVKDDKKKWYEDNKEKTLIRAKKYNEENKEQIKIKNKEYREINKEHLNQKSREYNEVNKDKIKTKRFSRVVCVCGADIAFYETKNHPNISKQHKKYVEELRQE
jgi:hypothetical protein